jgi:hypothetical protein
MMRAILSSRRTGPRFARPEDKLRPGPIVLQISESPKFARCQRVQGHDSAAEPWMPASAGMTILGVSRTPSSWGTPSFTGVTTHG